MHRVAHVVEKPAAGTAPSNLAIIGRYILTPKIFEKLSDAERGAGGEMPLTNAIEALMAEQSVYAYEFEGDRLDAGHDELAQGHGRDHTGEAGPRRRVASTPGDPRSPSSRSTASGWWPGLLGRLSSYATIPSRGCAGHILSSEADLADIGTILGDRYRLIELLDRAGGHDLSRPRRPARARRRRQGLRPEYGRDPDFFARFRQEAQSAASLNHPGVVAVYDYGTESGRPVIVMELVDGEDLGIDHPADPERSQLPAGGPADGPDGAGDRRRTRARVH